MKRTSLAIVFAFALVLLDSAIARGDVLSLHRLGRASDGAPRIPVALSESGWTVAGEERAASRARPFIWHLAQQGPHLLPIPIWCNFPRIAALSGDGVWAVGSCSTAQGELAFRASTDSFELLGGGEVWSYPRAVSFDGSVVVGSFISDTAQASPQAFIWRVGSGYQAIQIGESELSEATSVSRDGQVVAIYVDGAESFLWTGAGGGVPLGIAASIIGMDQNASTLLGAFELGMGLMRAFLVRGGTVEYLDNDLSGGRSTQPTGISEAGDFVCGNYSIGLWGRARPFVWSSSRGFQTLEQYISEVDPHFSSSVQLREAAAMNSNGLAIAGMGVDQDAQPEGWVLRRTPLAEIDLNHDGILDGIDVAVFFELWEAGESSADINLDGGIDGQDLGAFFDAFEQSSRR